MVKINNIYVLEKATTGARLNTKHTEAGSGVTVELGKPLLECKTEMVGFYVKFHTIVRIPCDLKTSLSQNMYVYLSFVSCAFVSLAQNNLNYFSCLAKFLSTFSK